MLLFLLMMVGGTIAGCLTYHLASRRNNLFFMLLFAAIFMVVGIGFNIGTMLLIGSIFEDRGLKFIGLDKVIGQGFLWPMVGAIVGVVKARKVKNNKPDNGSFSFLASPSTIYFCLGISAVCLVYLITASAPKDKESAQQVTFDPSTAVPVQPEPVAQVDINREAEKKASEEHYKKIFASHPDASQIAESSSFSNWLAANPQFQPINNNGTTQQVIDMLWRYKVDLQAAANNNRGTAKIAQPQYIQSPRQAAEVDRAMQNLADWSNRHNPYQSDK